MNSIENINEENVRAAFHKIHASIDEAMPGSNYLMGGKLGMVLYYFSLYEGLGDNDHANKCIELLEEVMNQEEEDSTPLAGTSFANGTAGLGYILSVLQQAELIDTDMQEDLKELDESMAAIALKQIVQEDRNDFLHGAMGVIHYFTTRSSEPPVRQYLETLVEAFCNKAVICEDGLWFRNFIIDEREKVRIDTGLSHGNAGFLLILLNVLKAGILETRLKEVISKGIQFLINMEMVVSPVAGQYAFFPFSIHSNNYEDKYFSQRLAWCYGDLNIILLLYRAAAQLNEPAWKELADRLAMQTTDRTEGYSTLATDSHFCHGTSGLAQFYRTLYTLTQNEIFAQAAEYWIVKTLKCLDDEWRENYYTNKECDLLNGLPGINLVLLSYISKKELTWSRSLLL